MKPINPKAIFYIMIGIFIILLLYFAIPFPQEYKRALFPFAAVLGIVFFILGGMLTYLSRITKDKKLRFYLMLTGISAVLFLVGVLLHNLVYGLGIWLFGEDSWNGGDEAFFFIIATIISPILFIIGMIGSLVCIYKGKKNIKKSNKR